jgi:hypothetical protein
MHSGQLSRSDSNLANRLKKISTLSPQARTMLESLPPIRLKGLQEFFPSALEEVSDLRLNLLHFNPKQTTDSRAGSESPLRQSVPRR